MSADKIWVNRGDRPFQTAIANALDKHAAEREGVHLLDCCWFSGLERARWTDFPVSIYYTGYRPESGFENRYFGLNFNEKALSVTIFDADRIEEMRFAGVLVEHSGEFVFSRWRHDFRGAQTASISVDGGLDYFRAVGSLEGCKRTIFAVRDGEFVEIT